MTSLVTGGAGFIGSHVAEELSRAGEQVVSLDDLSGGFRENVVGSQVTFVEGSINNYALIEDLFRTYQFETVFHFAAYAAEGLSHFIRRFNYQNNLIGSINLINAAVNHHAKTFVFTSSIAVYGTNRLPMIEELEPAPEDPYGIAKAAVEQDLKAANHMFGLNYIIFRPHNVYGERQNIGDRYRNVIGIFMNQILQGKPMTIFGNGEQKRAFTHISDVSPVIARSIHVQEAQNQIVNLGADRPYTLNYLAETVAEAMGVDLNVVHLPARNEVFEAYSSHEKAQKIFHLSEPLDLKRGVYLMAEWVKQVGARTSKNFEGVEIQQNLPPSWRI